MALQQIKGKGPILAAIREWRKLGAEAFRASYGTKPSKRYFLVHDGEQYDLKPIAAAAHRAAFPNRPRLRGEHFHTQRAAFEVRRLGFEVFVSPTAAAIERERRVIADKVTFDPHDKEDGRTRTLTAVVLRQGQGKFRKQVLSAYGRKCAVSGCDVVSVLDAAHIVPYRGPKTNHVTNGILLRTDLHTLFDLRLMSIDPKSMLIRLSPELHDSDYGELHGRDLRWPAKPAMRPSPQALAEHFKESDIAGW